MNGLTPKQQQFTQEYLIDLNATQAAIRAGYSSRSAEVTGAKLLRNAKVATKIRELMQERSERTQVTADMVLEELARLGFYDPRDIIAWGPEGMKFKDSAGLSEDDARVVASISESPSRWGWRRQVKFADRLRALELLGKHLGMFTDKFQMSSLGGGPIEFVEIVDTTRSEPDEDDERREVGHGNSRDSSDHVGGR